LQRYRHVVARKRQHGLTTTLIYATTPPKAELETAYLARGGDLETLAKITKRYFPRGKSAHLDQERAKAITKSERNTANGALGGKAKALSGKGSEDSERQANA
ncbi:hypothetical protein, partial [Ralstonia pseudosolanacearum]